MIYRTVAERIAGEILKEGKPGERLPGVRELARRENISLVTARNAYQYLVEKGLVVSRQGAGTFVSLGLSGGPIDMASIRPPEDLLLWIGPHLKITLDGLNTYDPPQGYEPLRESSGAWLRTLGIPELPIITAGSQQALFLVGLALLKKGDAVAVEDPGYQGAVRIFESLGATIHRIPHPQGPEDIERIRGLKIRMLYTMPQGHIPTGRSIPEHIRGDLVELAHRKGFYIIEDDPLSELVGVRPLKARDTEGRVIYIKSLSNILGPGLRIGLTVVPQALYRQVLHLKEINDLSISGILQRGVHSLFSSPEMKGHIHRLKTELASRIETLGRATAWTAQGACLWIRTSGPSRIHQERLLARGLRITPGDIYGPQWSHHIRLSLLTPSRRDFEHALKTMVDYLEGQTDMRLTEF